MIDGDNDFSDTDGARRHMMRSCSTVIAICMSALTTGCVAHLFSRPNPLPSTDRPVVRIETRGGVEYGAATDHGILFLGRTATEGPCRVHYFLGSQVHIEDGTIEPAGGMFFRAEIDLKLQHANLLGRDLDPGEEMIAVSMTEDDTYEVELRRAEGDGIDGDILRHPGFPLAVGTPLFVRDPENEGREDELLFVGLVAGEVTMEVPDRRARRMLVFTGADRVREMLLSPQPEPSPAEVKHRPDGITVIK